MNCKLYLTMLVSLIQLLFLGCRKQEKYPFAIKNFNEKFEPYLIEIVSKNIVGYDSATHFVRERMNDEELIKLSQSEHPVLRATALRELIERKDVNQRATIINHLDDTAIISFDMGEWGTQFRTVSDDMIEETRWIDSAERTELINTVILKNSYLSSAYKAILKQKPLPEYYQIIFEMTKREWPRNESEMALLALASYQKKDDIPYIRKVLLAHRGNLSEYAYQLIQKYPDSSYLSVLEKNLRGIYVRLNWDHSLTLANAYVKAVAQFRNQRSEDILSKMFNRKPIIFNPIDTAYFKNSLSDAIIANNCPEYAPLIKRLSKYIEEKKKDSASNLYIEMDSTYMKNLKSHERIVW